MRLRAWTSRWLGIVLAAAVVLSAGAVPPRADAVPLDWAVPGGHFFSQANGQGGANGTGFAVTNSDDVPFWTEFQRLGGVDKLGYPVTHRFDWEGFTVQAFQKAVLQWQPGRGMFFVNVFDRLSAAGLDDWLESVRATPPSFDHSADNGQSWGTIVARHWKLLEVNPAIKAAYFADDDPVAHFGLPMSYKDYGNVFVIRTQRAVFQQWRQDTAWARAGTVTIANGGDIAKEAGLFPKSALEPAPAGAPASRARETTLEDRASVAAAIVSPAGEAEAAIIEGTNAQRRSAGLATLVEDEVLDSIARQRSQDLIDRNYFSHNDPATGALLFDSLLRQQYSGYRGGSGENLYQITATYALTVDRSLGQRAVDAWMNSPGHRANILNGIYRKIGVGVGRSGDGSKVTMTQVFLMGN